MFDILSTITFVALLLYMYILLITRIRHKLGPTRRKTVHVVNPSTFFSVDIEYIFVLIIKVNYGQDFVNKRGPQISNEWNKRSYKIAS